MEAVSGKCRHWKQTDCWYFTEPGTKKRLALFDEDGERIRGKENKEAAKLALARIKLVDELNPPPKAVVVKNYVIDKSEADTKRFYFFILSRRFPLIMLQHTTKPLTTNNFI